MELSWLPWFELVLVILAAAAALVFWRLRHQSMIAIEIAHRAQADNLALTHALEEMQSRAQFLVRRGVAEDFDDWDLSEAEREVAWFMLRGLPFKQIAAVRRTSERTVRQQAQSIYRKAGLEGRSDLAGRVLERFL